MKVVLPRPCEPNADWTLQQLEEFIHTTIKRTAEDAYRTGKALKLARRKVKEAKTMTWTQWKQVHGFSDTTVSRYIRLFESYESVDALGNLGVIEACEKAGILARGKNDREPRKAAQAQEPFAWAIDEHAHQLLDSLADLDDSLGEVLGSGNAERLRDLAGQPDLRARLDSVKKRIDRLLQVIAAVVVEPTTLGHSDGTGLSAPTLAI